MILKFGILLVHQLVNNTHCMLLDIPDKDYADITMKLYTYIGEFLDYKMYVHINAIIVNVCTYLVNFVDNCKGSSSVTSGWW